MVTQNEDSTSVNTFKPNYDYVRSEMMTVHHNEGNVILSNHSSKKCLGKSIADISNNYGCAPTNRTHPCITKEGMGENIYSRPIELSQSQAKLIESNSNGSCGDVMTSSCPPASLFRNSELPWSGSSGSNGISNVTEILASHPHHKCHNMSRGDEIYSNGNSSVANFGPIVPKLCSDRPYSTLMNNSPPPRPPSLLRRNKPMNTSPHHHHYYHHQRDSGHASIGSSEDLSPAPPLPPRYSSKFVCTSMLFLLF